MSVTERSNGGRGFLSGGLDDDGLHAIHGTAIGDNDVTRGHLTGEEKRWTPSALQAAAHTLEGKEIVVNHENQDAYSVVGEITDARHKEGEGVIYQGVVQDAELVEKIDHGWLEVSPRIIHSEEGEEDETGAFVPDRIFEFDNLSIVNRGAAPSNEANLGEHEELMSVEELQEEFGYEPGEAVSEFQEVVENQDIEGDLSRWVYEDPNGAIGAAQGLGCDSYHEHVVDEETVYMPCSSHDKFLTTLRKAEEEMEELPDPEEFEGQEEEELAHGDRKRLAGQLSSHTEMTRDQALGLLESLDPAFPADVEALALAVSSSLDVEVEEARDAIEGLVGEEEEGAEADEPSDDSRNGVEPLSLRRVLGMSSGD